MFARVEKMTAQDQLVLRSLRKVFALSFNIDIADSFVYYLLKEITRYS